MSTEPKPRFRPCFLALALGLASALGASAQPQLSSPIAAGSGPGVHSPDSPFAPLKPRSDVLSWELLTSVVQKSTKDGMKPAFNPGQLALDQKTQRLQGFMLPLEPGEKQKHFLLTSVPMSCSFCIPGGPESMVEVRTKTAVRYSMESVVVVGKFVVLKDDKSGLYYRLTDAVQAQ